MAPPLNLLVCVDELSNQFVVRTVGGMRRALEGLGWEVEARAFRGMEMPERMAVLKREVMSGRHAAFAFSHLYLDDAQALVLKSTGAPLGYLGGMLEGVDWVVDDGNEGAFQAAVHLAELGHQRVALLSGDPQIVETRLREAGFQRGLRSKGLKPDPELMVRLKDYEAEDGLEGALALFRGPKRPTAILAAAGDLVAQGVYAAAAKAGLRIPQDLSVVGYDDLPLAAGLHPPLSTVKQPLEVMAARLATELVAAAEEGGSHNPAQAMVHPELIVRQSTAEPRSA